VLSVGPDLLDHVLDVLPTLLGLLADQRLHILVGDDDPGTLRQRLEGELACNRQRCLSVELCDQRGLGSARRGELRLGRDATACERTHEAVEELAGPGFDERAGGLDLRSGDENVDGS